MSSTSGKVRTRYIAKGTFFDVPAAGAGEDGKALTWDDLAKTFAYAAYDAEGTAADALAAHIADGDPHAQYLLESAYTAADVLSKLLAVDGASSGLDADLLDGQHASAFAAVSHSHNLTDLADVDITLGAGVDGYSIVYDHDSETFTLANVTSGGGYSDEQAQDAVGTILVDSDTIDFTYADATPSIAAEVKDGSITSTKLADGAALAEILDDDGTGSGLDADLLDGQHASAFAAASHDHTASEVTDFAEAAQDAVGAALVDSDTVDFTYTDATPSITAIVKSGSITSAHLEDGAALAEILDDDGAGSGLDADLLDGQHASAFAAASHSHTASDVSDFQEAAQDAAAAALTDSDTIDFAYDDGEGEITAEVKDGSITSTKLADGAALAEILDDDGAGSGLDADLLDGQHAAAFAAASHTHSSTDVTDFAEAAQDAIGAALVDSDTIDFTYTDATPAITAIVKDGSITDTKLADGAALAEILDDDGAGSGLDADLLDGQHASAFAAASHSHTASDVSDFQEAAQDAAAAALTDSDTIDFAYDDSEGEITAEVKDGSITSTKLADGAALAEILDDDGAGSGLDADLLDGQHAAAFAAASHSHTSADVSDFTEAAQDAIGAMLDDSATIALTYTDATPAMVASVIDGSIGNAKLADMAQNTVKGRITASTGAPEDLTATNLITILLTADGASSGLDADLLDGQHASAFAAASHSHTLADLTDVDVALGAGVDGYSLVYDHDTTSFVLASITAYTDEQAQDAIGAMLANSATISFTYTDATPEITAAVIDGSITNAKLADMAQNTVKGRITASTGAPEDLTAANLITILLTADGAGSGLDADLLDGQHASAFAASSHSHATSDITSFTEAVQDIVGALIQDSSQINVTYNDGTGALTLAPQLGGISNIFLAPMTGPSVKGRLSGTGDPQDLTAANVLSIITGTGSSWYDAIDSALDSITDTVFGGAFGGNRVRIVNGAIGIGGTSPAANAPLHIKVTAGEGLRIQGSGTTGDNSIAYLTFYDVNGTTRRGFVGDGSTFNDDIYLQADTGAIRLRAGGGSDTLVLDGDDGTLTGALTAQRFITRTDSIADDAVVSFAPNQIIGTIILSSSSFGGSVPGIIHYRAVATATCTKIAGGANLNVTTGVLTGTTGTDGRVTVSCTDSGIVYVENRMGGQMSIRITILG